MPLDIGAISGQIAIEDQVSNTLNLIIQRVENFAKSFEGALGVAAIGVGVLTTAVVGLTAAVTALGARGAEIDDVAGALDQFSGSAENATKIMDALRSGTHNTINNFDLMQTSAKLLAAGVKLTADDFGTLSKAAYALQNQGFGPTKQILDQLNVALLTGSTRRLRFMGITVDTEAAERRFAASMGKTRDELTELQKKEADRGAILDALSGRVREAGKQEEDFNDIIDQLRVGMKNWFDELALGVARSPVVMKAFRDIQQAIFDAFGENAKSLLETVIVGIEKFARGLADATPKIIAVTSAVGDFFGVLWDNKEIILIAAIAFGVLIGPTALGGLAALLGPQGLTIIGLTALAIGMSEAADKADDLTSAVHKTGGAAEDEIPSWAKWYAKVNTYISELIARMEQFGKTKDLLDIFRPSPLNIPKLPQNPLELPKGLPSPLGPMAVIPSQLPAVTGIPELGARGMIPGVTPTEEDEKKLEEFNKAVKTLLETLREGEKDVKVFNAAFSQLTDAQLKNKDVQDALLPTFEKILASGGKLSEKQQREYRDIVNANIAYRDFEMTLLDVANGKAGVEGSTYKLAEADLAAGRSLISVAQGLGVSAEALKRWMDQTKSASQMAQELEGDYNRLRGLQAAGLQSPLSSAYLDNEKKNIEYHQRANQEKQQLDEIYFNSQAHEQEAALETQIKYDSLRGLSARKLFEEQEQLEQLRTEHAIEAAKIRFKIEEEAVDRSTAAGESAYQILVAEHRVAMDQLRADATRAASVRRAEFEKSNSAIIKMFETTVDSAKLLGTAVEGSFAQMMLGAKSFKEGWTDIWESIQAATLRVLNEILAYFLNNFLKSMLNSLRGAQGGLGSFFGGLVGGGRGGLLGMLGGGGGATMEADIASTLGVPGTATAGGGLAAFLGPAAIGGLGALLGYQSKSPLKGGLGGAATGALLGTTIFPGIGTLLGGLLGGGAGAIAGLFGGKAGPSKKELEGRSATDQITSSLQGALTAAERLEVAQNVAAGGSQKWATQIIGLRHAYEEAGFTAEEASAKAEATYNSLYQAEVKGGNAVELVWAGVEVELEKVTKAHEEETAAAERVKNLADTLSGKDVAQSANDMVAAIEKVGGVTKLTASEQERANDVVQEAIDKYRVLGLEVPQAWLDIAEATKDAGSETQKIIEGWKPQDLTKSTNDLVSAFMQVGGAVELTKDQQKDVNSQVREAIASYEDMGREVPEVWRQIANATDDASDKVARYITQIETANTLAGTIYDAFGNPIPKQVIEQWLRDNPGDWRRMRQALSNWTDPNAPEGYYFSYAGGTPNLSFQDFAGGRWARLHGREAVVPEDRMMDFVARNAPGGSSDETLRALREVNSNLNRIFDALPLHIRDAVQMGTA